MPSSIVERRRSYLDQGPVNLDEGWGEMKQAIDKIIENVENGRDPMLPEEYINVYTVCYMMCTQRRPHNYSSELYSRHNDVVRNYLSDTVLPSTKRDQFGSPDEFLRHVLDRRKKFEVINTSLKKVFTYLEQYYTKYYSLVCLYVSGLTNYKRIVYDAMKADVLSAVLTLVDGYRYRTADDSDESDLIVRSIRYIDGVGTDNPADPFDKSSPSTPFPASTVFDTDYFDEFEPRLLTNTIQHYQYLSLSWDVLSQEVPEYLIQTELALKREAKFAKDFLHEKSSCKLMEAVRQTLLKSHQMKLHCRLFLQHAQFDLLRRTVILYENLEDGHGLKHLADIFQEYLTDIGTTLWRDFSSNEESFVLNLRKLHEKYLVFVVDVFDGRSLFHEAQQQALTNILNFNEGVYSGVVFLREFSPSTTDAIALFCADVVGIPSVPITVKKNHLRDAMVIMNNLDEVSLAVEKLSFQYILDEGDPDQGTDWFKRIMATLLCHDDAKRLSVTCRSAMTISRFFHVVEEIDNNCDADNNEDNIIAEVEADLEMLEGEDVDNHPALGRFIHPAIRRRHLLRDLGEML